MQEIQFWRRYTGWIDILRIENFINCKLYFVVFTDGMITQNTYLDHGRSGGEEGENFPSKVVKKEVNMAF